MENNNYSLLSKWMHKLYLGNYFVSRTSFDFEQTIYKSEIQQFTIGEIVFVTGLARAGTTALFRAIYESGSFASLKYSNMPFLLMPILWGKNHSKQKATEFKERAHKDGIKVNSESPEAFDEYFWKSILEDNYIDKNSLRLNSIDESKMCEFENYIKSICIASNKTSYLSKNNNNILRIPQLINKFPTCKIIMVYRDPIEHAKSLLRQHQSFSELQKNDSFALNYFNYLGHHEFGLNHKPFNLDNSKINNPFDINNINYWLTIWLDYYQYVLLHYKLHLTFIAFTDICNNPVCISSYLNLLIKSDNTIKINEKFNPILHKEEEFEIVLAKKCFEIYEQLNYLRTYI